MKTNKRITITCRKTIRFIELNDLLCCKSENYYTWVNLTDGREFLCSKPLSKLMKEINDPDFIRVSQSILVNSLHIDHFDKSEKMVKMKNDTEIPFTLKIKNLQDLLGHSEFPEGEEEVADSGGKGEILE